MLSTTQAKVAPMLSTAIYESCWEVLFKDLRLFLSLCIARFIVHRVIRRERNERAARLKRIKLVSPAAPASLNYPAHYRALCKVFNSKGRATHGNRAQAAIGRQGT